MPLGIYMDVHVPAAITSGLRNRGIVVVTSQEDGTRTLSDEELLVRATALGMVLFFQDTDLLRIAHEWQDSGRTFSGVVFASQLDGGIGELVEDLELLAACASAEELAEQVVFLPWR